MTAPNPASVTAARDQALAAARDVVAPLGGRIVNTDDALLTVVIDRDGFANCTGTTKDWPWVAASLRSIADVFEARAAAATDLSVHRDDEES